MFETFIGNKNQRLLFLWILLSISFLHAQEQKTGNASVNYYNTKVETKVKVALEGITATGIPVTKKVYYTIKK